MNELISIIVPVYKVEKYLNRCIDSILNQTYTNFECILVDDGSPDNCPTICDEYSKIDSRIKVIHKSNGGLSSARNAGLDICQGEYVCFIDSDDWIADNYLKELYNSIKTYNADIAICGMVTIDENNNIVQPTELSNNIFSREDILKKLICENSFEYVTVCNKLFKIKLFQSNRFFEQRNNEDLIIIHSLYMKTSLVITSNLQLYYYFQRKNSIMHKVKTINNYLDLFYAFCDRIIVFEKNGFNYLNKSNYISGWNCYKNLLQNIPLTQVIDIFPVIKRDVRKISIKLIVCYEKSFKAKIQILLLAFSPRFYKYFVKN